MKKHLINWYLFFLNIPFLIFTKKPKIMTFDETINEIVLHKKSISRFGDGEIRMLLNEGSIGFQNENSLLTSRLMEVLQSNLPNSIICLPDVFRYRPETVIDSQIFWLGFNMLYAKRFILLLNLDNKFGTSGISRFYMASKNKNTMFIKSKFNLLKQIWNLQNVLIIEGKQTKLGVGHDLFDNVSSIERILCPAKNAFDKYDLILDNAKKNGNSKLILIALGPTASILSYDLAKMGLWAIDIGHIDIEYSWFLNKSTEKMDVKGKYVNESENIFTDSIVSFDYDRSIIFDLSL
jgi:glycosyltransferase family protein